MKYTIKQRLEIYRKLLADWNFTSEYEMNKKNAFAGFCFWFQENHYIVNYADLGNEFPELLIVKPEKECSYWYPYGLKGQEKRVLMIEYVIRYTVYKLMADFLNKNIDRNENEQLPKGLCRVALFFDAYLTPVQLPELWEQKPKTNYEILYPSSGRYQTLFWWKPYNYKRRLEAVYYAMILLRTNLKHYTK